MRDNSTIRIASATGDQTVVISGQGMAGGTIVLGNALGMPFISMGTNQEGQGRFGCL